VSASSLINNLVGNVVRGFEVIAQGKATVCDSSKWIRAGDSKNPHGYGSEAHSHYFIKNGVSLRRPLDIADRLNIYRLFILEKLTWKRLKNILRMLLNCLKTMV